MIGEIGGTAEEAAADTSSTRQETRRRLHRRPDRAPRPPHGPRRSHHLRRPGHRRRQNESHDRRRHPRRRFAGGNRCNAGAGHRQSVARAPSNKPRPGVPPGLRCLHNPDSSLFKHFQTKPNSPWRTSCFDVRDERVVDRAGASATPLLQKAAIPNAFTYVVAWAECAEDFVKTITTIFSRRHWTVLEMLKIMRADDCTLMTAEWLKISSGQKSAQTPASSGSVVTTRQKPPSKPGKGKES